MTVEQAHKLISSIFDERGTASTVFTNEATDAMATNNIMDAEVYEALRAGEYQHCARRHRDVTFSVRGVAFDIVFALQGGQVVILVTTSKADL